MNEQEEEEEQEQEEQNCENKKKKINDSHDKQANGKTKSKEGRRQTFYYWLFHNQRESSLNNVFVWPVESDMTRCE